MSKKKKQFEVLENESISDCLARMEKEGYRPVRRIEKPIFQEIITTDETNYQPISRQILFEGQKTE